MVAHVSPALCFTPTLAAPNTNPNTNTLPRFPSTAPRAAPAPPIPEWNDGHRRDAQGDKYRRPNVFP